jgi:hypothetical protein
MVECGVRHSQHARSGSSAAERSSPGGCFEHFSSPPRSTATIRALGSCWVYRPTRSAPGSLWRQPPRRRMPSSQVRQGSGSRQGASCSAETREVVRGPTSGETRDQRGCWSGWRGSAPALPRTLGRRPFGGNTTVEVRRYSGLRAVGPDLRPPTSRGTPLPRPNRRCHICKSGLGSTPKPGRTFGPGEL